MKLELTHRDLRRLAEQQELSVDDVLNFIYDFCQDVKDDTGNPVEKLPCREEDDMYRHLPWMGRLVMKINREKGAELGAESRRERIRVITGDLEELDLELDEAKKLHQELRKQQDEKLRKEEAIREEKQEVFAVRKEIGQIETAIRELEELDLEEYQARKEALENEYREKRDRGEAEKQKAEEELAAFREERERILLNLRAERDRARAELEEEKENLRFGEMDELKQGIRDLRERTEGLRELQERILHDWNSRWGREQRGLPEDAVLPEMAVKKKLESLQEQTDIYEEQLRQITIALSSRELL